MAPPPPSVPFISLRTLSHLSWYRGRLYSQQFFKQQTWDPWKVKVLVAQSCPTLATPWTATRQAHLSMGFSRQEYWSELSPAPGDLPYPRIEPGSPALQVDSLSSEPPMNPNCSYLVWNSPGQNTGVGSSSFLQGIFPKQGSNPGLLHCRRILYQLSYQGALRPLEPTLNQLREGHD